MKVDLDVSRNILEQFCSTFGRKHLAGAGSIEMAQELGVGRMDLVELPNKLEFYHYTSKLVQPLEITTTNPAGSGWFGLNINLDDAGLLRRVGETSFTIQKNQPSGILVHTPGSVIAGTNPPGRQSESVFVRFNEAFVHEYVGSQLESLCPANGEVLYEDLDYRSEMLLRDAIRSLGDRIKVHARLLEFMRLFLKKIANRDLEPDSERLHSQDIRGVFRAAAALRDPIANETPSIGELAELASMGATKFKTAFRAVFGVPPLRYNHKVKMEFAYDELVSGRKTPTEVSYGLGYSHPSKFTVAFKKHFGELPSRVHGEQVRP